MTANKPPPTAALGFQTLKDKQRAVRAAFPSALGLRVHRAISWFGRAEAEADDPDVRFIILWVGFNSAYASDLHADIIGERGAFSAYFEALVSLDTEHRIFNAVWERFPHEIRLLINNKFVFSPFWNHENGLEGYSDWSERLAISQRAMGNAISRRDTVRVLSTVFDRLYVLRNQLVHGGATWNSSVNRRQVQDGCAILGWLLPIFVDLMMDNPKREWGRPFYPVVD